ncbi:MAG: hypothetical protein NZ108_03475 [Bacteroidia bacterium]|nr:hypothetical protein [Bacteroidia bacterium]
MLVSCKKEETPPPDNSQLPVNPPVLQLIPTASFVAGNGYRHTDFNSMPNQPFRIRFEAQKGPDDKDTLTILIQDKRNGGTPFPVPGYPRTVYSGTFILDTTFYTPPIFSCAGSICNTMELIFVITGKSGNSVSKSIKVTAAPPIPGTPIHFQNVIFTNFKRFFASSANQPGPFEINIANTMTSQVDLSYFYSDTALSKHSFISPWTLRSFSYAGQPFYWGGGTVVTQLRSTVFRSADFDTISSNQTLRKIFEGGADVFYPNFQPTERAPIQTNRLYAYRNTNNGKIGLIRVNELAPSGAKCEIKFQN